MPFIGQQPVTGAYHKLDSITTSATATYNLQLNGGAYSPASANHLLVSLNGVIQAPQDSFTVSGSQITFASALTSSDNIDFIMAFGDVLSVGVPTDGSVNTSQLANDAVTTAKIGASQVTDAKIAGMASSKLTGAMPALDGSALTDIGIGPYFFAYKTSGGTASQSLTNDADNLITLDGSIVSDSGSWASNKFTVPSGKGGTYFLQCQIALYHGSNALKSHVPKIFVNGSMVAGNYAFIDYPSQSLTLRHFTAFTNIVTTLSAGDYVELYVYPQSHSGTAHCSQGDGQGQKATNIWGMRLST